MACALLATASVAALLHISPSDAQESGLRGPVNEAEVNAALLKRNAPAQDGQFARYQPVSEGAAPDQGLFSEPPGSDDAFSGDAAPLPGRQLSTARQRAEDTRLQAATTTGAATRTNIAEAETDDTTTATVRLGTIDSETNLTIDPGAARESAIERGVLEQDYSPFAPPGIRMGSFVLRSSIEQGLTATSNADFSSTGSSALLSETALRLNAVSDWSSHAASIDAYGLFRKSVAGQEESDAEGGINSRLDLELGNDFRAIARLGYNVAPESATSPVVIVGTASQPLHHVVDGSLGLEKDVGKMRFGVTGGVIHDNYSDAELSGGGSLSQRDRNSTLLLTTLRGGYEISPALTPFAEVEFGRRNYELRLDSSGFERSATRFGARAGFELDMGEKLSGEVSAGWLTEDFDDDRLRAITTPTINADFRWSPERGTVVGLNALTTIEDTTTAGASGSVLYAARLSVDREIRANLTGYAALGAALRDYAETDEHDTTLIAEAGLTWWLNRYAGLTGRLSHETFNSTLPDRSSKTNSIFFGIKAQR